MTKEQLYKKLKELQIPVAYHHFDSPPEIPFIAYVDIQKDRFLADNFIYWKDSNYRIELYYENTDGTLEDRLEDLFEKDKIVWLDEEPIYIETEKLYLKAYYI